ncbi:acyltransferase family protein [Tardiphaga sp. 619_E2_N8_5]|uniref:acyltransferase family protein n=1 Tax=unclassified Tardiphaga TaxID=2631404 RepID=UPI003F246B44
MLESIDKHKISSAVENIHPKYRPDIDGLRALAVLSVVLFHAFPTTVTGGFVGVDVFFVISGFLISTILFGSLIRRSKVDILDFYARRIRRIFPALSVVLLSSLVFAFIYLLSGELGQFGKHLAGGAGFVSNIVLWFESGYFDVSADSKPLLHLWSLGVEEQFYIIWPILLWLAWKLRLNLVSVCCGYAAVSFAMNISMLNRDPIGDFYSPQSRFWQMCLGAILALTLLRYQTARSKFRSSASSVISAILFDGSRRREPSILSDVESVSGIFLILLGIFCLHTDSKFPGWWALLPTVGAILFISAGPDALLNRTVFSSRVAVWFGLISFPLYLWHWPILSFSRILWGGDLPAGYRWFAVALSVALAWLTFTFIETPIRKSHKHRCITLGLMALMAAIGLSGYVIYLLNGLPTRPWSRDAKLLSLQQVPDINSYTNQYGPRPCFQLPGNKSAEWFTTNGCLTPADPSRPTAFLLGDSHSASLSVGLREIAAQYQFNLLQMSSGWCGPFGNDTSDPACVEMNRFADDAIRRIKPDVLILNAYWLHESTPLFYKGPDFISHLEARFLQLQQLGAKKVIVVGQIPTWKGFLPDILARRYVQAGRAIPIRTNADLDQASIEMDRKMRVMRFPPNTYYVPLVDALCNAEGCLTRFGDDLAHDLVVWDYGHLTFSGSRWLSMHIVQPSLPEAFGIK